MTNYRAVARFMNHWFCPALRVAASLLFFAGASVGSAAPPHPHFHTIKLLLNPTDQLDQKGTYSVVLTLLREGYSPSTIGSEPSQNKGWYAQDLSRESNLYTFSKVRNGRYTVYLDLAVGMVREVRFPVTQIEVTDDREIALTLPPMFHVNVRIKLADAPADSWDWFLEIEGVDAARRHYQSAFPVFLDGDALVGPWNGLLVPGQYSLTLNEHRMGIFERGRRRSLKWGPVHVTPKNVMEGTITMDLHKIKFSEERNFRE